MATQTLTARYLFPVDGAPISRGTLTIDGDHIAAVDPAGVRTADIDLGNAAILPGLINAHTHLDLSDAAGKCHPSFDFTGWLRCVIAHRRQQTPEQIAAAVAFGIRESLRFGVTAVGDISAQGESWIPLVQSPLNAVVYREAIGLGATRADAMMETINEWCAGPLAEAGCQRGVSPHAPYTVGRTLFERLKPLRAAGIPFATHLGETRGECKLLAQNVGSFVDFLTEMGVYDPTAFVGIEEWMNETGPPSTFIHCNQLMFGGQQLARARGVIYCPRTFFAFGHEDYPLREFLRHGVNIALGTDSLASNPDLNILAEARRVSWEFPDIPRKLILMMITHNAALALSDEMASRVGTLTPGKNATITVVPLPDRDEADPHRLLFDSEETPSRTMIGGVWTDQRRNGRDV